MKEIVWFGVSMVEWIGYLASVLVLVSLSLSSIVRLRVVNLLGSIVFSAYGFLIGSLPVGIMNLIIVLTNIFYLRKLYSRNEIFEVIEAQSGQEYVRKFLRHHQKDIHKYFPEFKPETTNQFLVLMIVRDMNLAGLFIAEKKGDLLEVELDYVTPPYRDYKNGVFLFEHFRNTLKATKYKTISAKSAMPQQVKYLKKMGFVQDSTTKDRYVLAL